MNAIEVKEVSKEYKLYTNTKEVLLELFFNKEKAEKFIALKDINFNVRKGISYGIVGDNGSGKSTILRIISNNTTQTQGEVKKNGKVSILNVGAGISQHYTGMQNIYYKGALNGLTKSQVNDLLEDIIEFSELGKFIEQPVRKYSSGMRAKLGFSIAIHCPFDILIVDEALAVGDATFREKCMRKMNELQNQGKTILFVSHAADQVRTFCERCCWINNGELIAKGKSEDIIGLYKEFSNKNITIEVAKKLVDYDKRTYYAD